MLRKKARNRMDEVAEYIKANAPIQRDRVINHFAPKMPIGHRTVSKYLKEQHKEGLFFKFQDWLVRERLPPYDVKKVSHDLLRQYEIWKHTRMKP